MRKDDAFPSKYVSTPDLKGRSIVLTIERIVQEEIGDHDMKAVVYFLGMSKGWILNVINWNSVEILYGPETNDWIGKQVELYPDKTSFGRETVDCIRVRAPLAAPAAPVQAAVAPAMPTAALASLAPAAPPAAAPQGALSDEDVVF